MKQKNNEKGLHKNEKWFEEVSCEKRRNRK